MFEYSNISLSTFKERGMKEENSQREIELDRKCIGENDKFLNLPSEPDIYQKLEKLKRIGLIMLIIMAAAMMVTGALGSIKWENSLTELLYNKPEQRFATAAVNVSTGLIFLIASIGNYLPASWGLKMNVIGCVWYLIGIFLLELAEFETIIWTESLADIIFWGAFPIVQITCVLVGTSRNPAIIGHHKTPEPA